MKCEVAATVPDSARGHWTKANHFRKRGFAVDSQAAQDEAFPYDVD